MESSPPLADRQADQSRRAGEPVPLAVGIARVARAAVVVRVRAVDPAAAVARAVDPADGRHADRWNTRDWRDVHRRAGRNRRDRDWQRVRWRRLSRRSGRRGVRRARRARGRTRSRRGPRVPRRRPSRCRCTRPWGRRARAGSAGRSGWRWGATAPASAGGRRGRQPPPEGWDVTRPDPRPADSVPKRSPTLGVVRAREQCVQRRGRELTLGRRLLKGLNPLQVLDRLLLRPVDGRVPLGLRVGQPAEVQHGDHRRDDHGDDGEAGDTRHQVQVPDLPLERTPEPVLDVHFPPPDWSPASCPRSARYATMIPPRVVISTIRMGPRMVMIRSSRVGGFWPS